MGRFVIAAEKSGNVEASILGRAERHGRAVSQIVFRFAIEVGIIPLTGTTDAGHMRADLEVFDFQLAPDEIERIGRF